MPRVSVYISYNTPLCKRMSLSSTRRVRTLKSAWRLNRLEASTIVSCALSSPHHANTEKPVYAPKRGKRTARDAQTCTNPRIWVLVIIGESEVSNLLSHLGENKTTREQKRGNDLSSGPPTTKEGGIFHRRGFYVPFKARIRILPPPPPFTSDGS